MEIIKIVPGNYIFKNSVKNVINYVSSIEKTKGKYIGALGVDAYNPNKMIKQMEVVKCEFEKEYGYRQLRHIVVSFEGWLQASEEVLYFMAYDIAKFYGEQYQICFGVHVDTDNVHIHFVQNTVSYIDGRLFSGGGMELAKFKQHVWSVVYKYYPEQNPIKSIDDLIECE